MPETTIERVYLLGLGALGTMYAAKLQRFKKSLVKVIVDEERKDRYEQEQIFVNGNLSQFEFITPRSDAEPADLIIVALKQHHLPEALPLMAPFVGKNTAILSLLNGISSEEIIARHFGEEHLLYGFGVQMDVLRRGRDVTFANMGYLVFGEKNNHSSERVEAVKDLLHQAEIPFQVPPDILKAMWFKFMLNVAVNQVSALMKMPFGQFGEHEEARNMLLLAAREVRLIAQRKSIAISDDDMQEMMDIILALNPAGKTSMLQDVEAHRKTEVEIFAGEVVRQGGALGIETPINRFLLNAIVLIEKQYRVTA
ncbi:ketopantoate reductase family protein [Olivibacter sp. XZL3]|uniref:ketopantoate reductase family protein n=1 Tax=Olivibacter sp. XZL3 TaxID=1735116 RepID=UPI001064BEAB|nr:ketopantoate reductase family protein [Olivibacter sp. XZL3]